MKLSRFLVGFCGGVLVSGMALVAQAPSIIEPKVERHQGPPLWISAEAVADEEKIIDLELVASTALSWNVEKQRKALGNHIAVEKSTAGEKPSISTIPPSECTSRMGSSDHRGGEKPSATLVDLAAYSDFIVRGIVRAVEQGFSFGEPGSMLTVETLEVIKGPKPRPLFYIDYPIASFRIGPLSFCNLNKGYEPRVGDEVLLFDYTGPVDRDDLLYAPRLDQLFFQRPGGILILPPRLKNTPGLERAKSLADVVGRLRSGASPDSPGSVR